MTQASSANSTIYLAGDIGTSGSKFFYRVRDDQKEALWMGSGVADGLTTLALSILNAGGRPQDHAWLQVGNEVILVGDAAKTFVEGNSLVENKANQAVYKIVAALGVIAEKERMPSQYEAVIWLPLPLTEMNTKDEIAAKLTQTAQNFRFRGMAQQVRVSLKFCPEGFGLYLNRKAQLDATGVPIDQRRTFILMMGHRNLSVLCFEQGSLKSAKSNSDGPGFWPVFERVARSCGVTPADYPALMAALSTGKTTQVSQAKGELYDFAAAVEAVRQAYWKAARIYLQDNLLGQLSDGTADMIISGGAAFVMRQTIKTYFDGLRMADQVIFADGKQEKLDELVNELPESTDMPSMVMRMSDCYGLFQGLVSKYSEVLA
ncbi:MAG: hypothetical protein HC840_05575 [Leptolyngbyaceae cyanobacterium RM2_2_4]|nr:hypothetical protein [Leptolyngbyaceae cyanobacterium SM1_4_3]NJO49022.1 hypothetical protein [Leptolyngbyaceae cyanobacterium RM2_2_4]